LQRIHYAAYIDLAVTALSELNVVGNNFYHAHILVFQTLYILKKLFLLSSADVSKFSHGLKKQTKGTAYNQHQDNG